MVDQSTNDINHPGWGRLALSVVFAITVLRILVVVGTPLPLFFDEAQYWFWAQDLAFGYFSKPPFIAWSIAATTAVCGDGAGCVRLSAPLFHGAASLVLFALGRHFYDGRAGFWAAVAYATLPGVTLSAVVISTDAFLLFFWACALFALVQAEQTNGLKWWAALGMALGLGLLSKYAMVFFLICLIVDALWQRSGTSVLRRARFWLALAIAAIIYAPNLWWNWINEWPSYLHTGENANLGGDLVNPLSALEFFGSQFGVFGPILFVALLWLTWQTFQTKVSDEEESGTKRRLLAFCLPILAIILLQAFLSRSHANWAATAYVAGTVLVVGELSRLNKDVWVKASVGVHVVAAILFYNFDFVVRTLNLPITPDLDPMRRVRGWDRAGDWVTDVRQEFPGVRLLFDDRKVMSEMLYYVRPHPLDAVMWNPKGQRKNHFEMTTDLSGFIGEDFIYVIKHDWPGRAATSFDQSDLIGTFRSRAYTGDVLEIRAYFLQTFQGYER